MYGKACNLYEQICADGLEPDATMYNCLMKFAVKCGRTELSKQLSEKAPSLDIKSYMSLIRAAGRDKDVEKAFSVLGQLKASGLQVDNAVYNCVLDVCVSAGNMQRAQQIVQEIKEASTIDLITCNTILKGYCLQGDLEAAGNGWRRWRARGSHRTTCPSIVLSIQR